MDYHESWNTPDFDHDICIVTLKEPLNLDDPNVAPIDFFKLDDGEIPAETVCNRWHLPLIDQYSLLHGDTRLSLANTRLSLTNTLFSMGNIHF